MAYIIVDEMNQNPQLFKDQYWNEIVPQELPHTVASEQFKSEPPVNSTADVFVSDDEGEVISPPSLQCIYTANLSHPRGTLDKGSLRSHGSRYSSVPSNQNSQYVAPSRKGRVSRLLSAFNRTFSQEPGSRLLVTKNFVPDSTGEAYGENLGSNLSMQKTDEMENPTVQTICSHFEDPISGIHFSTPTRSPKSTSFEFSKSERSEIENKSEKLPGYCHKH